MVKMVNLVMAKMVNSEDVWRGDVAFKSLYPRVYTLESCKNVTVAVKISHENVGYSLRRIPRGDVEQVQFLELLASMEGVALVYMRDSCETAQEIWLRIQQMMKIFDIKIQENKAKFFNEWERFTSTDGESIESYYHRFSKLMNDFKRNTHFPENIVSNLKFLNNLQPEWSRHVTIVHQTKDLHTADYTQLYDFLKSNQKENLGVQNVRNQNGLIVVSVIANQNPNGNGNVVAAQAESNAIRNNDGSAEVHNYENFYDNELFNMFTQELEPILKPHQVQHNDSNIISEVSNVEQDGRAVDQHHATVEETLKFVRDFKSLAKEADESLAKHNALELKIEGLLRAIVSQDIMSVVQRHNQRCECEYSILGKPPSSSSTKLYVVTPFPKSKGLPKIDKTHALSKPVTSNSVPTPQETKVVKNDYVIAPEMFRINPFKPSRKEKYVPNKVRVNVKTNLITVSQSHVLTKKDVNSDSNGLSSTGVDNTTKTRRPQPMSNTKNDRVPSASKSSCIKKKKLK
uniref:RNA-directed DNA polymerase, eukaryota, reverse transcriptase zinc-binding domain protein n=1 Tax=Tanacetum cinerariifolium TaxID=118510 RepID=A0A6L2N2U3_TANCI|nr:RNA-directed DNA polymerase, eukaryota, reverse transcriptase zinc-binding domain protein [Tanacetum cinerariifolium]